MHNFLADLWNQVQDQRDRWPLWLPVPLATGIGAYFSLTFEPPGWLGLSVLFIVCMALLPFYRILLIRYSWIVLFLVALGFTAAQFRTQAVKAPILYKRSWKAMEVTGRIAEIEPLQKAWRMTLENLTFDTPVQKTMPERVRVKLKGNDLAQPVAGDIVKVKAVLLPLSPPTTPGAFDFQRYAYFKKLGATGYALSNMEVIEEGHRGFFFENLRRVIRTRVEQADVADKDTEGLIKAFLIGDKNAISETDWDVARNSGIVHLIAISGSHFIMVVGFAFFLVRAVLAAIPYIALRWPIKKIAAVAGMGAAIFYMMLIGAPVTAQRATLMSCVVLFAIMIDRDPVTLRVAAFAALVLLLFRPENLIGASFQLSFAAVTALIAFFESTKGFWGKMFRSDNIFQKISLFMVGAFLTTAVAQIATTPFSLFHFMQTPLLSGLAANMIAVPVSSFMTFPVGLLACVLMPFGLEKLPLWIMAQSTDFIMAVATFVTRWPHMIWDVDRWPVSLMVIAALGGLWLCIWQGTVRWLGVGPVIAALVFIPVLPERPVALVSADTKLAAVRAEDGILWISSKRRAKFVANAWIEQEGGIGHAYWPRSGQDGPLTCDARACFYDGSAKITFILQDAVTDTDCERSDLVFMLKDVKQSFWRGSCDGKAIDKGKIYRHGAHAVFLRQGVPVVVRSSDVRGTRPWVRY